VWDENGRTLAVIEGHRDRVDAVAFSPDGKLIATGSQDFTARIWDLDGRLRAVLRGHENGIPHLAFSPSGDRVYTGSGDGTVRTWDLEGRELECLPRSRWPCTALAVSASGEFLLTGYGDGSVRTWFTRGDELLRVAGERVTRELTRTERQQYAELLGQDNAAELAAMRRLDTLDAETALVADAVERVRADAALSEPVRAAALRILGGRHDDPKSLNERAWNVARTPGRSADEYRRALRWAAAGALVTPDDGNMLNTLGVAQYRAEDFRAALRTLTRSDEIASRTKPGGIPEDVAFLALAHARLGHPEEATRCLARLRSLMTREGVRPSADARAFLAEAETVVGGAAAPAPAGK